MGKEKKDYAAGPESAISGACLTEVTKAFEKAKVPDRDIAHFGDLAIGAPPRDFHGNKPPEFRTDFTSLEKAVDHLRGVPEVCKVQAEAVVEGTKPVKETPKTKNTSPGHH